MRIKIEEVVFKHVSVIHGDVHVMAETKGLSKAKQRAMARWLPTLAEVAADKLGASRIETLEILTDVDQVTSLFASLEELRQGHIVKMSDAFGDL